MDNITKMEKWITQLRKHAWCVLDTLKVTSVHKLDPSMKVSPSPVWELALLFIKEPFSQQGCEPYFPVLKPHREVPYPNYMEMSLVSVSKGGALMSYVAELSCSPIIGEILGHPREFAQPVTHFSRWISAASERWSAVRWKNRSHMGFRLPTPSPDLLPECATPICQRKSPAASVGAGYQHVGAKSLGRNCVSVTLQSVQFIPFLWQDN